LNFQSGRPALAGRGDRFLSNKKTIESNIMAYSSEDKVDKFFNTPDT
jgi:hypothetical protein